MSTASPPKVQDLFAHARGDAPGEAERVQIWDGVAAATGATALTAVVASKATSSAPSAFVATSSAVKLLAVGAILGGLATSAIVALLSGVLVIPGRAIPGTAPDRARSVRVGSTGGVPLAAPAHRRLDPAIVARRHADPAASPRATMAPPGAEVERESDLEKEARLVSQARAALVAGNAERALALVRGTQRLESRALEPEELGLEARALRALDRADEAASTELVLRRRFPEHALAR